MHRFLSSTQSHTIGIIVRTTTTAQAKPINSSHSEILPRTIHTHTHTHTAPNTRHPSQKKTFSHELLERKPRVIIPKDIRSLRRRARMKNHHHPGIICINRARTRRLPKSRRRGNESDFHASASQKSRRRPRFESHNTYMGEHHASHASERSAGAAAALKSGPRRPAGAAALSRG